MIDNYNEHDVPEILQNFQENSKYQPDFINYLLHKFDLE